MYAIGPTALKILAAIRAVSNLALTSLMTIAPLFHLDNSHLGYPHRAISPFYCDEQLIFPYKPSSEKPYRITILEHYLPFLIGHRFHHGFYPLFLLSKRH